MSNALLASLLGSTFLTALDATSVIIALSVSVLPFNLRHSDRDTGDCNGSAGQRDRELLDQRIIPARDVCCSTRGGRFIFWTAM